MVEGERVFMVCFPDLFVAAFKWDASLFEQICLEI